MKENGNEITASKSEVSDPFALDPADVSAGAFDYPTVSVLCKTAQTLQSEKHS